MPCVINGSYGQRWISTEAQQQQPLQHKNGIKLISTNAQGNASLRGDLSDRRANCCPQTWLLNILNFVEQRAQATCSRVDK